MCDLSEKFQNLEVSSELFKDVKFFVSGEVNQEFIELLTKGGADQLKYFSDFVTHLICGENPEETDIIDATDVYEVPAVNVQWILMSTKLNKLVNTKPYLYNRQRIFSCQTFSLSKVKEDLETLWALITYNGGKVQLNLDKYCNYLVTTDTCTPKYEKAMSLGPENITIVTPDWIVECIRKKGIIQPDLFHPRLIDWPKPVQQVQHESTTTITGFEESENQDKDNENDEVASSTQALLEKLKQRMPWNQPEPQPAPQPKQNITSNTSNQPTAMSQANTKVKEIVPPNVVAPSFQQKNQGEHVQTSQHNHLMSHQQILQKLQLSQNQSTKSTFSSIPQQMTPEQQQMVQNALQQAQQNIHSQRLNQQNLMNAQQQIILNNQQPSNILQSSQSSFTQQNIQSHIHGTSQQPTSVSQQTLPSQQQQNTLQSPPQIQEQNQVTSQPGPRTVVHHPVQQSQQLQTQNIFQQNPGISRLINRPSLQQLRGQLGSPQLQQQLLQQQQQRLNQQQNTIQRSQLSLQQQQLLQLQLSQGQIDQARQLLQQNQQQLGLNNQTNQPTSIAQNQNQHLLNNNQVISNQHLNQNQLNQTLLQNRNQQLSQQKIAQNHQLNQLLAQRQAQLNQRLNQQITSDQLLQGQSIGQPQLVNQQLNQNQQVQLNQNQQVQLNQNQQVQLNQNQQVQLNQNQQVQLNQNQQVQLSQNQQVQLNQNQQVQLTQGRLLNQNQAQLLQTQQLKLAQQNQQLLNQNHQLGQSLMEINQITQVSPHNQLEHSQQLGQIGQNIQQQHLVQNQNQIGNNQLLNQALGQNQQVNQGLTQNQIGQGLSQNQLNQSLNQGMSQNQQINQGLSQNLQQVNQGLSQNQQMHQTQQLSSNQLLSQNESLGQGQQMTQTQRLLQSQQLNPQITQTVDPSQQVIQSQQISDTRQQLNLGLNHILNQQMNQNQIMGQPRLNQSQLINQQLNQLNQQLNQNQLGHQVNQMVNQQQQQVPQSPIAQNQNQQFGNVLQQQQLQNQQNQIQNQQILGSGQIGQVRQVVSGSQQVIQFNQNQQFNQIQQQDGSNQTTVQNQQGFQQQLLLNQQNQFGQQAQGQPVIQQNQPVRPHIQQQLWAQQQNQGQVQLPRQALNIQQGQRIQWTPGQPGPGPQRQFIQLDAQTHNQLQKMPPEQQALFVQKLQQKQRQLLLKQAQQRGGSHILIRGSVPPGLSPQQQMAWLQQQAKNQGLVIPNNLQQQTISSTTLNQQTNVAAAPTVGPSNIPQTPGLSPIQQNQPIVDPNQLKLKQLRLQQLQREQLQKSAPIPTPQPNLIRPMSQPQGEPQVAIQDPVVGQSPLIVNPKTKTALANMLSIRLQSGGTSVGGGQEPIPEPSAAGTLRLMTAQHNASLNANNRPLDLIAMQQRRVINGPNGEIIRPPVPPALPVTPQNDPPQLQFSPRATLPVQHRPGPFYGHNPNLKLPPDLYFLGCIFVVVEVDDYLDEHMPNWVEKIEKHGGEVEKQYCSKVTHVLCETQRHGVVMQALRDCKRCVTLYWLADIMRKKQLLPPWTAIHVPTIYLDTTPCSKHLISSSGFAVQDKGKIKQMIHYTGAKYTRYFSKHNTLLIAAKQEGPKYNHAKKWGTPVVNIQWLTDVMLGNFVAMNQMENIVYQQYSDPPNFSFDPKICPNLMHGWKMPINISQETYERVKRSASPALQVPTKVKQPKTEKMDESDNNIQDNVPTNSQYNILFSNVPESGPELVEIVKKLGGSVTKDHHSCTHLIMESLNRTNKVLFCIPRGVPILPKQWLLDCEAANMFLEETSYTFPEVEKFNNSYDCNLYELLKRPNRDELFKGRSFWVTPSVFPNQKAVVDLIETCGGTVERIRRSAAQIEATNQTAPHSYFIITHEDDIHLTADLLRNKKERVKFICNTELIFNAIMSQKIDVEPWAIKVIL